MVAHKPFDKVKLCMEYNLTVEIKPDGNSGGPYAILDFSLKAGTKVYYITKTISSSQPEFHFQNVWKPFDLVVNDWNKIRIIQSKEGEDYWMTMRVESNTGGDVEVMKQKVNTPEVYEEVTITGLANFHLPGSMKNFVITSKYPHAVFSFRIFFIFIFNYFVLHVHKQTLII